MIIKRIISLTLNNFFLLYHTLKYLTKKQIFYRIYYNIKRYFISYFPQFYISFLNNKKYKTINDNLFLINYRIRYYKGDINNILDNKYTFLNETIDFREKVDWHLPELNKGTRLWKMNLNYHEYLLDIKDLYLEKKHNKHLNFITNHIEHWINENRLGNLYFYKDNWNCYTISNRSISWIKLFSVIESKFSKEFKVKMLQSLRTQIEYLSKNIEYDLRGNHILENGFALLFAACFFNDRKLYRKSKIILTKELNEQVLNDGCHFELSPMYHQHILYRLFDCCNLIKSNQIIDDELSSFIKYNVQIMLGWLEDVTFSNGDIPLLNDCSNNMYPTTKQLFEYARLLGITPINNNMGDCGYRKIKYNNNECLVDIGKIGPDYIPGHAHNDIFSFVLYKNKKPFIIDTGISTYNFTDRRMIERSTSAHNTVKIGKLEQSEMWSSFRVANRNYPRIIKDEIDDIRGFIKYATNGNKHYRSFLFKDNQIIIKDRVESNDICRAYLHFHPNIKVTIEDDSINTSLGKIYIDNEIIKAKIDKFLYAPEFNILEESTRAVIEFKGLLKIRIT